MSKKAVSRSKRDWLRYLNRKTKGHAVDFAICRRSKNISRPLLVQISGGHRSGKYFADMHKMRRKQRQARFVLIGVTLAFVISVTSCGFNKIKPYLPFCEVQTDAESLELAECETHTILFAGRNRQKKSLPIHRKLISTAKEKLWVIDYESSEDFVRFMVDNCGGIEDELWSKRKGY